jgi:hypothetical protein
MHKPFIAELIAQVSDEELRDSIFYLSKDPLPFRKANYMRPGQSKSTLDETDDFVEAKLRGWGYKVESDLHQAQACRCDESKPRHHWYARPQPDDPWYTVRNLHARVTGARRPDEIICVVAHKDSPSWIDSPGAHDNAGGAAGALEIARVLAGYQQQRSLWLLFCNEEHMPWTSVAAARAAKARGDNLIAIINLDALAGKSLADRDAGRKTNVTLYTTPEGEPLTQLMAEVNEAYGIGLEQTTYLRQRPGDDDGSFIKAGYPAAIANFGSYPYADPNYHEAGDTAESVDVPNLRMTVQATLAAILTLDACVGHP